MGNAYSVGQFALLGGTVKEDLTGKVTFAQTFEGGEAPRGKEFQAE